MNQMEEQGALVKSVFCEAYKFYLKYHGRPMDPGAWQEATGDFGVIMRDHGGAQICGRIMLATFEQLEKESR